MHKQNPRSTYIRSLVINSGSGSSSVTTLSAKKNIEIKGYCTSVSGDLNLYYKSLKFANISNAKVFYKSSDVRGSKLSNVSFLVSQCPDLAGCIREGDIKVVYNQGCDYSIVDSYITFTKDRTETCITPLGENESILINSFITYENLDFYYTKDVGIFKPLDLNEAIINARYLFTNSKGKITITSGEMISGSFETGGFGKLPNNFTYEKFKNSIKLDDTKKNLIIDKPLNNYVIFDFKFRITIKQEATDQFREGTTSVILEFTRNSQNIFPKPRCSVNDNYGDCIDYLG